jgi:DNA-binding transcriptional MerR regulator
MGMTADDDLLTPSEAAQILGISASTLRRLPDSEIQPVLRTPTRGDRRYLRRDVVALRLKLRGGEVDTLLQAVESITDPADRARAALRLLDELGDLIPNGPELRARAERELRDAGEQR